MKTRTLFTVILTVLLVSSVSLSQETPPQEPSAKETPTDPNSSKNELVTEIVALEHFPANELTKLISNIFRIRNVYSDRRSNRLIIQTTRDQINDVLVLIDRLDVESDLSRNQEIQNVVHRIYMLEIPSKDADMKPFSMILQTSPQFPSTELLNAAKDKNLRISGFHLSNERRNREQQNDILIQGKAASNESIKQFVDSVPESRIKELQWDDYETFTSHIAAAQYTHLPEQIQKHIVKFLGKDIQTVGYLFGSSSVPGRIEAPIGPWTLDLSLDVESDNMLEIRVDVEVPREMSRFDRQLGRERDNEILSNTMRAKIGKPIIVGYNRQSYGTRKMGAMVILLEADIIHLNDSQTNAPSTN